MAAESLNKDLAEQLRTVQFALLALCLAIAALLGGTDPGELQRAETQADEVLAFSKEWDSGRVLAECATKQIPALSKDIGLGSSVHPGTQNIASHHNLNVLVSFLMPSLDSNAINEAVKPGGFIDSPVDLEKVSNLFDALGDVQVLYPEAKNNPPQQLEWNNGSAYDFQEQTVSNFQCPTFVNSVKSYSDGVVLAMTFTGEGRETQNYDSAPFSDGGYWRVGSAKLDARGCFSAIVQRPGITKDSFMATYPDLMDVASDLRHVRLDDLRKVLHKLTKVASIEVFGIHLEGTLASLLALIMLLVVEVYFLIHLIEFRRCLKIEGIPPVAWFGLYHGIGARILFICAQALPVIVVILLARRLWSDVEESSSSAFVQRASLILLGFASFVLALLGYLARPLKFGSQVSNRPQKVGHRKHENDD